MVKTKSISAFFPAWNEWGTLGSLIIIINHIFEKMGFKDNEIIIVDNGSDDNTKILLDDMKKGYPNLKVVELHPNQGYGGALKAGFEAAKKDLIFYSDADLQYHINELETALELMDDETDVIVGYKTNREDPLHRIIIGELYKVVVRKIFKLKTKDVDCDFRVIRRSIMDKIKLEQKDGLVCIELMKKIENRTKRIKQIPVRHFARVFGSSKFFDFAQVYKTLKNLLKLRGKLMKELKKF